VKGVENGQGRRKTVSTRCSLRCNAVKRPIVHLGKLPLLLAPQEKQKPEVRDFPNIYGEMELHGAYQLTVATMGVHHS
jgi:hypothetical protein